MRCFSVYGISCKYLDFFCYFLGNGKHRGREKSLKTRKIGHTKLLKEAQSKRRVKFL